MIHVIIGYFKFPKYIGHISEIDITKIHVSIANIHFPHTLFIHNTSQLIYLQMNHNIKINKFKRKRKLTHGQKCILYTSNLEIHWDTQIAIV